MARLCPSLRLYSLSTYIPRASYEATTLSQNNPNFCMKKHEPVTVFAATEYVRFVNQVSLPTGAVLCGDLRVILEQCTSLIFSSLQFIVSGFCKYCGEGVENSYLFQLSIIKVGGWLGGGGGGGKLKLPVQTLELVG